MRIADVITHDIRFPTSKMLAGSGRHFPQPRLFRRLFNSENG
jgi:hypothetical protein